MVRFHWRRNLCVRYHNKASQSDNWQWQCSTACSNETRIVLSLRPNACCAIYLKRKKEQTEKKKKTQIPFGYLHIDATQSDQIDCRKQMVDGEKELKTNCGGIYSLTTFHPTNFGQITKQIVLHFAFDSACRFWAIIIGLCVMNKFEFLF